MPAPPDSDRRHLLVGYDGSPAAVSAIETGALLVPLASAEVAHVWSPPFASRDLRRRVAQRARTLDELGELLEREGAAEGERLAAGGVTLAGTVGWEAEPLVHRSYGDEGFELARLAERLRPDAVVVGSRGLTGARAVLGSVSDAVVHHSPAPVLVVPHPLLREERRAVGAGPVVVGYDGSEGARAALAAGLSLFGERPLAVVAVGPDAGSPAEGAELARAEGVEAKDVVLEPAGSRLAAGRGLALALADEAARRAAAVIVVGSRGRSPSREILVGSVAMATLHNAHRPVLVVPGSARAGSPEPASDDATAP